MSRFGVLVALLTIAGGFAADGARGQTLYVSPRGDDASSGSSEATALATIGRALRRAGPGTTILVLPGRYHESARVAATGTPERPIRLVGHGGRPVFDGGRVLRYGLWLEDSRHLVLDNLEFRDYTDIGLLVVLSQDVAMRRLRVHGNGFEPQIGWVEGYGVHLDESADLLLERSRFWDNGPNPRPWNSAGTGINGYKMRRAVIRKNRSFANHGGGILVEDSVDVVVKRNRVWLNDLDVSADEWWDGGIWLDGGRDVKVIGNRFLDNLGPGIEISDEDCQRPTGYVLKRNVSRGNYFGIFIWNFGTAGFPDSSILELDGNDFSGNTRQDVWIEPDLGCAND